MLTPQNFSGKKPLSPGNIKAVNGRLPTLSECLPLAGGNHFFATVLQKVCHYCAHPRFKIEGQMYTAPTTKMLVEELGLSDATVNKAIKMLKETGVIETKVQRFNRSPRRYIRLIQNPAAVANTLSEGKGEGNGNLPDVSGASSSAGLYAPSPTDTVHLEKKKKKKIQNSDHGPEQGLLAPEIGAGAPKVACTPAFSGESHQARGAAQPLWTPRGLFEHVELSGIRSKAQDRVNQLAYQLYLRRGWDDATYRKWQYDFVERCVREYRRKRAKEGPPKRWGGQKRD